MMALAAGALLFTACNSTPGPTGPQGPSGTNGTNGNANVQQYTFGSRTFTGSTQYNIAGITQAQLDSSIFLSYSQLNQTWYPVPGVGEGAGYEARVAMSILSGSLAYNVSLITFTGATFSTPRTFESFRIIVVPASTVTTLSAKGVNFNDYNAVRKYYNLPE